MYCGQVGVCVWGGGSDDVSEQQCDGNTRKLKTALVFVAEALMNQTPVLQEENTALLKLILATFIRAWKLKMKNHKTFQEFLHRLHQSFITSLVG